MKGFFGGSAMTFWYNAICSEIISYSMNWLHTTWLTVAAREGALCILCNFCHFYSLMLVVIIYLTSQSMCRATMAPCHLAAQEALAWPVWWLSSKSLLALGVVKCKARVSWVNRSLFHLLYRSGWVRIGVTQGCVDAVQSDEFLPLMLYWGNPCGGQWLITFTKLIFTQQWWVSEGW